MSTISDLPAELLIRITEFLPLDDCKTFSGVNAQFHNFLIPKLFKVLKASNHERYANSLQNVVAKYKRHVETLRFTCHLRPNKGDEDQSESKAWTNRGESAWTQPGFSQIAQELLSGKHLPSLKEVSITFDPLEDFNGADGVWGGAFDIGDGTSIYIHERLETQEERVADEEEYQWRADLNLAFKCLSLNTSIEKLQLHDFLPKAVATFYEPEWPRSLARLKDFELHLWGGDNGAGWHSSTLDGYLDFVACLPELVFQHLHSAKRVVFAAEAQSAIGHSGMRHTPIPLRVDTLPKIWDLTVKNCYIDQALLQFLANKAEQLVTLQLANCYSAIDYGNDDCVTWSDFFRKLGLNSWPALRKLEVTNSKVDLEGYQPDEERRRVVARIREEIKSGCGKKKAFPYAAPDDKYGDLMQYDVANVDKFVDGQDQAQYDALMAVVEVNQAKMSIVV